MKTVYILGAGFSAPAGGPSQAALLNGIAGLDGEEHHKQVIEGFLQDLNVDSSSIALEDIYTPIDRCLADGLSFRGKNQEELLRVRSSLGYLIAKVIQKGFADKEQADPSCSVYVDRFAEYLVKEASVRAVKAADTDDASEAKRYDPFSVISLNWDILLDNAINFALVKRDRGLDGGDYAPFGVVDYCCYISSIHKGDRRIRSGLWSLGCRGYNVKMLKIHGSMNWLQCPGCQRLFVEFGNKSVIGNFVNPINCRHCEDHDYSAKLRDSLVMPTFLKDLSNFQVKLIWQNAGVELMEARRLVFIGYSLPQADFEFRQLLSRFVHEKAEIHVVLFKPASIPEYEQAEQRYRSFFGRRKLTMEEGGVLSYVESLGEPQ